MAIRAGSECGENLTCGRKRETRIGKIKYGGGRTNLAGEISEHEKLKNLISNGLSYSLVAAQHHAKDKHKGYIPLPIFLNESVTYN